ncbi:UDP-2,4-diacetamido-2,4,6-trideoxy-beta-L-altropyranose hydrolase [Gracilibacillus sp. HCP3S3_G5_1]|uniref:UDP-2,4-diacetamido-2,4, 6-trideoxy-beta-L-altropyranose hydrolase n=1 Tax=unclassified Gracilibacillus TaxID=2625209 RepID=UPI003F889157
MRVGFRVDASYQIGSGHVMRCLVLANQLQRKGAYIEFFCQDSPGNLLDYIEEKGYSTRTLSHAKMLNHLQKNWQKDAEETTEYLHKCRRFDYFVVDHYGLDERWERTIKPLVDSMMVIDDLANRNHYCDSLLDQNLLPNLEGRYQQLVSSDTVLLLGPKYLLLRDEFVITKVKEKKPNIVKRILVSFGGSDPTNETLKTLEAIIPNLSPNWRVDVVTGTFNPSIKELQKYDKRFDNIHVYTQTNRIAELMAEADIAIGAGGTTTWERCYMQLPAITIEVASNQSKILEYLHAKGFVYHLGKSQNVRHDDIKEALSRLIETPLKLLQMKERLAAYRSSVVPQSVARFMSKEGACG